MSLTNRVGTFFIVVGIGLIVLFVLTDLAKAPSCGYLLWGGLSLALGIVLWVRGPARPAPKAERFRRFRKSSSKTPDKKK